VPEGEVGEVDMSEKKKATLEKVVRPRSNSAVDAPSGGDLDGVFREPLVASDRREG
jgi:hypothetical protein